MKDAEETEGELVSRVRSEKIRKWLVYAERDGKDEDDAN